MTPDEIRLVGGGARSAVWRRIAADVLGCPVVCPVGAEAGAMGCVVQAMWCADKQSGARTPITELAAEAIRLDPASRTAPGADVSRYEAIYHDYLALNAALAPLC